MQSRDELHQVISKLTQEERASKPVDLRMIAESLAARIDRMPKVGNGVNMNGLAYAVKYVDCKRGKVHLELVGEVSEVAAEIPDSA